MQLCRNPKTVVAQFADVHDFAVELWDTLEVQKFLSDGIEEIETMVGAHPKMAHAVAEEPVHLIATDRRRNIIVMAVVGHVPSVCIDDRKTIVDMSDIKEAVSAVERAPYLVTR